MAGEIALELVHRYESGTGVQASLRWRVAPGAILVILGPSGAGKTTILRAVAGLLRPQQGRIEFDGVVWLDSKAAVFVPPSARRIGYVAQDTALFPHLTVRENVEYGLRRAATTTRQRRTDEIMVLVGAASLANRFPGQLSGGQAQRVALARALAPSPALLLLDEPFGALDGATRRDLRTEVREALRRTGTSAILVTHDRLEAMAIGDDLAVMVDGRVRQAGAVAEVFARPLDADVARSLGVETVLQALVESRDDGLITLRVGEARILAVGGPDVAPGDGVFACVRAEDVTLERAPSVAGSARNHLIGRVTRIDSEGAVDRVTIDCGFQLVAAITRRSREELGLAPLSPVTAVLKATAIHVVPTV